MRLLVDIEATDGGWQVQMLDSKTHAPARMGATGELLLGKPRTLRRVGSGSQALALPPEDEMDGIDLATPLGQLLTGDEGTLHTLHAQIVGRSPGSGDVELFGRYLFHTLFGDVLWKRVAELRDEDPLELAFQWGDDSALDRLPWEMMHGPDGFLGELRGVAITRCVKDAPGGLSGQPVVPRVLFVVGSDLKRDQQLDVIRPGTEYLGLLESLRAAGLCLDTHILLGATPRKLEVAIRWFRPTVVHFICHGWFDADGKSFLQLIDDDNLDMTAPVYPASLAQHLGLDPNAPEDFAPQIVVLNACYTATPDDPDLLEAGQVSSPFAVDLIRRGAPVVVGMAGEVADRACRLFTRRFYEALLRGENIAQATAQGRRLGIIAHDSTPPASSVDWALPTLFFGADIDEVRLDVTSEFREGKLERIAATYREKNAYPAFCDRMEPFHWYELLMAESEVQIAASPRRTEFQAIAIADQMDQNDLLQPGRRHGKTWLLREIAARAVRDGHVPILVAREATETEYPKTLESLLKAIYLAARLTAQRFDVPWNASYFVAFKKVCLSGSPLPPDLPPSLEELYVLEESVTGPVLMSALWLDLMALRSQIAAGKAGQAADRTMLLLLIDDVHRMGTTADLLPHFLGDLGLRTARGQARAAITYASKWIQGQERAVSDINDWTANSWVEKVPLGSFEPPEDQLAYKQMLLGWRTDNLKDGKPMPLVLAPSASRESIQIFFEKLHDSARGIPSRLSHGEVAEVLSWFLVTIPRMQKNFVLLQTADDNDLLKAQTETAQGASD